MTVWIVLRNAFTGPTNQSQIDTVVYGVYDNLEAALTAKANLIKKWNIVYIVCREVKSL